MVKAARSNREQIRIPFRDVDMNGQMFLASYISYAESALAGFWSMRPELADEPLYIACKVSCTLHRPLRYEEDAVFTAAVDKIGLRSVGFVVAVDADGERAAEVEVTWQARSREIGEPVSLPEETRDWLYTFLD
ncbi:acyl-CoA thioesterase [Rhizobium sp. OAE497]|uniref:acyl-CoA thioesterase n=1 Tax=Rhizobium sp. OAE497 TaxID=2663796 RepID=UPI0018F75D6F